MTAPASEEVEQLVSVIRKATRDFFMKNPDANPASRGIDYAVARAVLRYHNRTAKTGAKK